MAGACRAASRTIRQRLNGPGRSCYGSIARLWSDQHAGAGLRRLRLGRGGLDLCLRLVVELPRALVCLARLQPVAIGEKAVALRQQAKPHRPHDLRTETEVGCQKAI